MNRVYEPGHTEAFELTKPSAQCTSSLRSKAEEFYNFCSSNKDEVLAFLQHYQDW